MKLKGEKELLAEELYDCLDNEMYEIMYSSNYTISKLDADSKQTFSFEMDKHSKAIQICYRITEVIYNMDLSVEESKAMISLSSNNKLLNQLYKVILKQLDKVNIYNDKELENFIRTAIALFVANYNKE